MSTTRKQPAPTQTQTQQNGRKPVKISAPEFNAETDTAEAGKDPQELAVEQQWRDVERLGIHLSSPDSINHDSPHVKG